MQEILILLIINQNTSFRVKHILFMLVLLWTASYLQACAPPSRDPLPPVIGGLRRIEIVSGTQARGIIDRMHGKNVTPKKNSIGRYLGVNGETAIVWVSRYSDTSSAHADERHMQERIARGNDTFGGYMECTVGGHPVAMCQGLGQTHYFFRKGDLLYWVAADRSVALDAVQGLIAAGGEHR